MSGSKIVLFLVAAMLQGCGFGFSSFSLGGSSTGTSLAPELAAKMQYDINRWQGGQSNCNKTMPTA